MLNICMHIYTHVGVTFAHFNSFPTTLTERLAECGWKPHRDYNKLSSLSLTKYTATYTELEPHTLLSNI